MKQVYLALVLLFGFAVQSCGVSAEDKQRIEQALLDRQAREDSVKALLEQMSRELNANYSKRALAVAELEAAQVTLERAKGWQFLRTASERDGQIMHASLKVQELEGYIRMCDETEAALIRKREQTVQAHEYSEGLMRAYEEGR